MCAGSPLDLVLPETLRWKVAEPLLLLGKQRFANVDIRVRVKGGGHVSQIYGAWSCCWHWPLLGTACPSETATAGFTAQGAEGSCIWLGRHCAYMPPCSYSTLCTCLPAAIRQAIAKSLVAFYQKCELLLELI
jgi:hypothetical protein